MKPTVHLHLHVVRNIRRTRARDSLTPGSSQGVISKNIEEMQANGHSHEQAVAAALHNAKDSNGDPTEGVAQTGLIGRPAPTAHIEAKEIDPPHFVTEFVREHKTKAKMRDELASRSVEHLQKAHALLQAHPSQDDDTNMIRRMVKDELDKREMPQL